MRRWILTIIIIIIAFAIILTVYLKYKKRKQILIEISNINKLRNLKYDEKLISSLLSFLNYRQLSILLEYLQAIQYSKDEVYINNLQNILIERDINIDEFL